MDYWYTFYQRYREDDNEWWRLSEGDMQNLFEDAAAAAVGFEKTATEQLARAEAAEAENARLRQELAEMAALWQCAIDADLQDDPCEMEAAIIRAAAMLNYPPPVDDD